MTPKYKIGSTISVNGDMYSIINWGNFRPKDGTNSTKVWYKVKLLDNVEEFMESWVYEYQIDLTPLEQALK